MPWFLAGETNVPASDMTIGTDYLQTNNGSGNNNNSNNGGDSETNFDTNMVIILAALLCALVCALGLNTIVRCALRCGRRVAMEQQTAGLQATAVVGLKKRALRKIPVEVYGPNTSVPGTECPICLGDFADGEKVRVLPKCHHGFHVRCIDTWLSAHPSCPTCRSLIIDHTASDIKAAEDGAQHLNNTETGHVTVRIADERR